MQHTERVCSQIPYAVKGFDDPEPSCTLTGIASCFCHFAVAKLSLKLAYRICRYCFTLADVQDDLVTALEHKNPKVKVETLKLIEGFVGAASKTNAAKVHASVLPAAAKSANEAAPDIREAALAVLVAFGLKAGSVSVLNKVTDKLDDSRKKKLEELVQQATTGGGPAKGPPSAIPSPRGKSPASSPASSRPSSARVCTQASCAIICNYSFPSHALAC